MENKSAGARMMSMARLVSDPHFQVNAWMACLIISHVRKMRVKVRPNLRLITTSVNKVVEGP